MVNEVDLQIKASTVDFLVFSFTRRSTVVVNGYTVSLLGVCYHKKEFSYTIFFHSSCTFRKKTFLLMSKITVPEHNTVILLCKCEWICNGTTHKLVCTQDGKVASNKNRTELNPIHIYYSQSRVGVQSSKLPHLGMVWHQTSRSMRANNMASHPHQTWGFFYRHSTHT